eukprot:1279317-Karenia_brevis.AAC.1
MQTKSHAAKFGAPQLLPNFLDADQHVRAAVELQHPFDMLPSLSVDLQFACDAVVRLGPDINSLRASA